MGWLGGRRAGSVRPLQPSLAIYRLSALLFRDIKQVSWEAARVLEALSRAVWGTASPRGLREAIPTQALWDELEQPGCGQRPHPPRWRQGRWVAMELREAQRHGRQHTAGLWVPGRTPVSSPSTPTSKPGFLNQVLKQESLGGTQECGLEEKK